jgi:hypothetical protein
LSIVARCRATLAARGSHAAYAPSVRLEHLTVEITGHNEGAIVLGVVPGEAEEGMLGLEGEH